MSVIGEILSSLLVLVVLHVAAFCIMTGYRYHTLEYYKVEAAMAVELALQREQQQQQQQQVRKPKKKITPLPNPLEPFDATVRLLSNDVFAAKESIDDTAERLIQQSEILMALEESVAKLLESTKPMDLNNRPQIYPKQKSPLTDLLNTKSIYEIPSTDLKRLFEGAKQEIREIAQAKDDDQRYILEQQLNIATKSSNVPKQPRAFVCPSTESIISANTDDDDDDNDDDAIPVSVPNRQRALDAAYELDLAAYLEKIETKFANRIQANGVNALLPKSLKVVQETLEDQLDIVIEDIVDFAKELEERMDSLGAASTTSSCDIDADLVASMVSAGLDAQVARADVQEALRTSIASHDPSISVDDLILDADLGGGGTCGSPQALAPINLRSKLDTPLLIQSIDWIDMLVDALGGYNDGFDQYLDSLTNLHGTTSVGEIAVQSLLEQAGKVGDIDVEKYAKEAKEIIHSITGKRF